MVHGNKERRDYGNQHLLSNRSQIPPVKVERETVNLEVSGSIPLRREVFTLALVTTRP